MDFKSMKRKQLQALCKKHGLPANSTNLQMVTDLTSLLQGSDKVKPKGCLKGSGGSSGEEGVRERGASKTVSFSFPEENFDFDVEKEELEGKISPQKRRSSRRKSITASEVVESGAPAVVWSPVVGKGEGRRKARSVCQNGELPLFVALPCEDEERKRKEVKESCFDGLVTRSLRNRVVVVQESKTSPGELRPRRSRKEEFPVAKNLKQAVKRPRGALEESGVPTREEPPLRRSRRNTLRPGNSSLDSEKSSHGEATKEAVDQVTMDGDEVLGARPQLSVPKANEAADGISLIVERRKSQRKVKRMDSNCGEFADPGPRTEASNGATAEKVERRKPSEFKEPLRRSTRKSVLPALLEEDNSLLAGGKFGDKNEAVEETTSLIDEAEVAKHELAKGNQGLRRRSRRSASEHNATNSEVPTAVSGNAVHGKNSKGNKNLRKRNTPDFEYSSTVCGSLSDDEAIEGSQSLKRQDSRPPCGSGTKTEALEDHEKFKEPQRRSRRNGSRNQLGDTVNLAAETVVDGNFGKKKPAKRARAAISEEAVSVAERKTSVEFTNVMVNQDNGGANQCDKDPCREGCQNVHDDVVTGQGELSSIPTLSTKETPRTLEVHDKDLTIAASDMKLSSQTNEKNNERTSDDGCQALEPQSCISGEVDKVSVASLEFVAGSDESLGLADMASSTSLTFVIEGSTPENECNDGAHMMSFSDVSKSPLVDSPVTDPCSGDQLQRQGNLSLMEPLENGLQSVDTDTSIKDKHFDDKETEYDGKEAPFLNSLDRSCEVTKRILQVNEHLDAEPIVNVGGVTEVASEGAYVDTETVILALVASNKYEKQENVQEVVHAGVAESSSSTLMADSYDTPGCALKSEDICEGHEALNSYVPSSGDHIKGLSSPITIETSILDDQKTPALIVSAHDAKKAGSHSNSCLLNCTTSTDNQDTCHQLSTKDFLEQEKSSMSSGVAAKTTIYSEMASEECKDMENFDTSVEGCSLQVSEAAAVEAKVYNPSPSFNLEKVCPDFDRYKDVEENSKYEERGSLLSDNSTPAVCSNNQIHSFPSGTPEVGKAALDFMGPNSCNNLRPCKPLIGGYEEIILPTCSLLEENKVGVETSGDKSDEKIITDVEAPVSFGVLPPDCLQEIGREVSIKEVSFNDIGSISCNRQRPSPVSNMAISGGGLVSTSFVRLATAIKRTSFELEEKSSGPSNENPYEDDRGTFKSPIATNELHLHLNSQDVKVLLGAAEFSSSIVEGNQMMEDTSGALSDIFYKETNRLDDVTASNSAGKEFSLCRNAEENKEVQCKELLMSSHCISIQELASRTDGHSPLLQKVCNDNETAQMHLKELTVASEGHQEAASETSTLVCANNEKCTSAERVVVLKIVQYNALDKLISANSDSNICNSKPDRVIQLASEDAADKLPENASYSIVTNESRRMESSETKENGTSHGNFVGDTTQKLGDPCSSHVICEFAGLCHASVVTSDASQESCQGVDPRLNGSLGAASSDSLPENRIKENGSESNHCDNGKGNTAVSSTSALSIVLSETELNIDCGQNMDSLEAIEEAADVMNNDVEQSSSTLRHSLVGIQALFTQEYEETSLTNGEFALGKVNCENSAITETRDYDICGDDRIAAIQPKSDCGHLEEDNVGERNEGSMKFSPEQDDEKDESTPSEGKLGYSEKFTVVSRSPESENEEGWIAPDAQFDLLKDLHVTESQMPPDTTDSSQTTFHEYRFDKESYVLEGGTSKHRKDTDETIELREAEMKSMTILYTDIQVEFDKQASSVEVSGDLDRNIEGSASAKSSEVGNLSGISTPEVVNLLDYQDLLPLQEKIFHEQADVLNHREDEDHAKFDQAVLSELKCMEEVYTNGHEIQDEGADLVCECAVDAKVEDNENDCYVNTTDLETTIDITISGEPTESEEPVSEKCIKSYDIEDINQSDKEFVDEIAPEVMPTLINVMKESSSTEVELPQEKLGGVWKSSPEISIGNGTLNNLLQENCKVDSDEPAGFSSGISVNHSPLNSKVGTDKNAYKSEEQCGTAYEMEEISQKLLRFRISSARKASKPNMKSTPVKLVKNLKSESVVNGARGKENTPAIKMDQSCKNNLSKSVRKSSFRRPLQSVQTSKMKQ